jgi:hypothetical protein
LRLLDVTPLPMKLQPHTGNDIDGSLINMYRLVTKMSVLGREICFFTVLKHQHRGFNSGLRYLRDIGPNTNTIKFFWKQPRQILQSMPAGELKTVVPSPCRIITMKVLMRTASSFFFFLCLYFGFSFTSRDRGVLLHFPAGGAIQKRS